MRREKKMTYLLSFFPGLGYLYLGLMNRGLQFLLLFFGTIFLTTIVNSFGFFIPIIVFYSYFDSLQLYSKYRDGEEIKDEPIVNNINILKNNALIGWLFIAVGGITVFQYTMEYLNRHFNFYYEFYYIKNALFGLLFIGLGIFLLRGKRKDNQ